MCRISPRMLAQQAPCQLLPSAGQDERPTHARASGQRDGQAALLESEAAGPSFCPPSVLCCKGCVRMLRVCCVEVWCGVGQEICKLLCCPPLPSRIASKLAFAPPPSSYDVRLDAATQQHPKPPATVDSVRTLQLETEY